MPLEQFVRDNKVVFHDLMMMSVLYQTNALTCYNGDHIEQRFTGRHVTRL